MSDPIHDSASRAAKAWRRAQIVDSGLMGLVAAAGGMALTALVIEIAGGGFSLPRLPDLAIWLLLVPAAAAHAALQARPLALAARELDRRAGLSDRVGTAFEFTGSELPLTATQRHDAVRSLTGVKPGALFTVPWRRRLPPLLASLVLLLLVVGASFTFQLGPRPEPPPEPEVDNTEDLLAAIDRDRVDSLQIGDKDRARLLTDMERRIRRIQAREEQLRETVKRRKPDDEPPAPDELEFQEPDLPATPRPDEENQTLITAEDLSRLEEDTLDQLAMTDAQTQEMVAELFANTRAARDLMEQFHELTEGETYTARETAEQPEFNRRSAGDDFTDKLNDSDLLSDPGISSRMTDIEDYGREQEDMIRNELSEDAMAEHDREHDYQRSFNEFLKEFVKDVQEIVGEAATGKKAGNESRQVKTNAGAAVGDKKNAMAQSGFEEMDAAKRGNTGAPSAPPEGAPKSGDAPPPDAEMTEGGSGENAMAIKGGADGKTSAGASGAGKSSLTNSEQGTERMLNQIQDAAGPLEKVLGAVAAGRMPPEEREALFDRIASHKVRAGLASEADDSIIDYFADAEELIASNRDSLPPLFRDYAHSYFESIKPGTATPVTSATP